MSNSKKVVALEGETDALATLGGRVMGGSSKNAGELSQLLSYVPATPLRDPGSLHAVSAGTIVLCPVVWAIVEPGIQYRRSEREENPAIFRCYAEALLKAENGANE